MQHPGDATADQPADDATGATTSERWLSASSWTRKRFASWDRKACSRAHPCRCVRRKIGRFWSASFVPKWRVTADEDGHYCFAVALWCSGRRRDPAG